MLFFLFNFDLVFFTFTALRPTKTFSVVLFNCILK